MKIKLQEIANLFNCEVIGNPNIYIENVSKIELAKKGDLTFLYHPAYQKFLDETNASAIIVNPEIQRTNKNLTYIVTDKPEIEFYKVISEYFNPKHLFKGIDESASISESSTIGENTSIGKNVVISENCQIGKNVTIFHNTVLLENVIVGDNSIIYPNVSIRENCIVGNNVIIHCNSVVGSDGFGYAPTKDGVYQKLPQIGNVIIEDDVEIGSNVSIDRAALNSTVVGKGCKIDNLVQIAHNVQVGKHTAMSAQTGISGSTKIGDHVILAGQVGVVGHIEIVDNVIVAAQSGVSKSIKKPGTYFGYPFKEISKARILEAHYRNLPEYSKKLKILDEKILSLQNEILKLTNKGNS